MLNQIYFYPKVLPASNCSCPAPSQKHSALRLNKALDTAEQLAYRFSHERLREEKSDFPAAVGDWWFQSP